MLVFSRFTRSWYESYPGSNSTNELAQRYLKPMADSDLCRKMNGPYAVTSAGV